MDERLTNRILNTVWIHVVEYIGRHPRSSKFCIKYFDYFLGKSIHLIPVQLSDFRSGFKHDFDSMPWWRRYDLLEFVHSFLSSQSAAKATHFVRECNTKLEHERSGYRFVDEKVAAVANPEEIEEIETVAKGNGGNDGAATHIRTALAFYADRDAPNFRNSVKESISAVEATAKWFLGDEKATLGQALGEIENQNALHPALKDGFKKLYGWASDEGGIRHALMGKDTVTEAEARFMLVSCSAFCNYLVSLKAHGPRVEA